MGRYAGPSVGTEGAWSWVVPHPERLLPPSLPRLCFLLSVCSGPWTGPAARFSVCPCIPQEPAMAPDSLIPPTWHSRPSAGFPESLMCLILLTAVEASCPFMSLPDCPPPLCAPRHARPASFPLISPQNRGPNSSEGEAHVNGLWALEWRARPGRGGLRASAQMQPSGHTGFLNTSFNDSEPSSPNQTAAPPGTPPADTAGQRIGGLWFPEMCKQPRVRPLAWGGRRPCSGPGCPQCPSLGSVSSSVEWEPAFSHDCLETIHHEPRDRGANKTGPILGSNSWGTPVLGSTHPFPARSAWHREATR